MKLCGQKKQKRLQQRRPQQAYKNNYMTNTRNIGREKNNTKLCPDVTNIDIQTLKQSKQTSWTSNSIDNGEL